MNFAEAITLIKPAFESRKCGTWCDLGCGSGLFTQALASLLAKESRVFAVDKSVQQIRSESPDVVIEFHRLDFFHQPLPFSGLDGILMANSLHYVSDKTSFLKRIKKHLKVDGQLVIVEYELTKGNTWVPYPVTYEQLKEILHQLDFSEIKKIGERQSVFGDHKMYACTSGLSP